VGQELKLNGPHTIYDLNQTPKLTTPAPMSLLPIILHPDARLKKVCTPIVTVDDKIKALAEDMLETMYDAPGVGLAGPQVGFMGRMLVMDCTARDDEEQQGPKPTVVINPEIVWTSEEENTYNEGCLSLPELYEDVTRPAEVRVRFLDQTGAEREEHYAGLWATCVQHEIDHLNGKLFIDHLSRMKRTMMTKKMIKFKKELGRGAA
jgi:peptide deformylase